MSTIEKVFLSKSNVFVIQLIRYVLVGGIAAVFDYGIFYLCAVILGYNHMLGLTTGFLVGLTINYMLSMKWVFNKKDSKFQNDYADFLSFAVIGVIGLGLSYIIMFVLVDLRFSNMVISGMFKLVGIKSTFITDKMILSISKLVQMALVLFWNFIARKKFVFNAKEIDSEN